MGSKLDIQKEILEQKNYAQDIIRRKYLRTLANYTGNDTILYSSGYLSPKPIPAVLYMISNSDVQGFMCALKGLNEAKDKKLDLIIHSPGGSPEATDQLVHYLRGKYSYIRVIVPENAMSAATMLCCAADEIVMGKHSAIGPIDPQFFFGDGQSCAAQVILDEFERAKADIAANQTSAHLWVQKFKDYPKGILTSCQRAIDLSVDMVAGWLDAYMLKGLDVTNFLSGRTIFNNFQKPPRGQTPGYYVATWLGDARIHKTHGRPIGIDLAKAMGLKVSALEDDQKFQDMVLNVFHSMLVTHEISDCAKFIENHNGIGHYLNIQMNH